VLRRLRNFFATARDVGRFQRLIHELGAPFSPEDTLAEITGTKRRTRTDALEDLTSLMCGRAGIASVLQQFGYKGEAAKEKLIDLYNQMIRHGLSWLKTTYIPAAVIYDPILLAMIFQAEKDGIGSADIAIKVADYIGGLDLATLARETGTTNITALLTLARLRQRGLLPESGEGSKSA
jgi:hypothetical protein